MDQTCYKPYYIYKNEEMVTKTRRSIEPRRRLSWYNNRMVTPPVSDQKQNHNPSIGNTKPKGKRPIKKVTWDELGISRVKSKSRRPSKCYRSTKTRRRLGTDPIKATQLMKRHLLTLRSKQAK